MKNWILVAVVLLLFKPIASAEEIGGVKMRGEFLNGNLLKITVEMKDFSESVLGVAFNLEYDDKLGFLRYEPGLFLEAGGDPFYLVQNNKTIIFGETLRRNDTFPDGSGDLVSFYFQIMEEGNFNFSFVRGVVSGIDTVQQDLREVVWDPLVIQREKIEKEFEIFKDGTKSNSLATQLNRLPKGIIKWLVGLVLIAGAGLLLARQLLSVNYK